MSEQRNLSDIVEAVANATGLEAKDARKAIKATLFAIQQEVAQGHKVAFTNFGSFTLAHQEARTARNPSTGAEVAVPEKWKPKFTPGQGFVGLAQQTQTAAKS
ncbi:HU family DNA-binding protein [Nonomuraea sp. NPDC050404]|uniref:HU family DNA-binding protein n=1 Tax=Nonomuraea sp. NPDC050404 TaxID=3155783 RepID=UPI00340D2762